MTWNRSLCLRDKQIEQILFFRPCSIAENSKHFYDIFYFHIGVKDLTKSLHFLLVFYFVCVIFNHNIWDYFGEWGTTPQKFRIIDLATNLCLQGIYFSVNSKKFQEDRYTFIFHNQASKRKKKTFLIDHKPHNWKLYLNFLAWNICEHTYWPRRQSKFNPFTSRIV